MLEVQEKRLDPQPVVVIRATAPANGFGPVMSELLSAVLAFVQASPAEPAGSPFCRYLSMTGEEWEFECGVAVTQPVPGEGRVEACELPGGDAITTLHVGPYETLGQSWGALQGWLAEQGRVAGDAPWELYHTDPGAVTDPAQWRTELVMLLESQGR